MASWPRASESHIYQRLKLNVTELNMDAPGRCTTSLGLIRRAVALIALAFHLLFDAGRWPVLDAQLDYPES